MLHESVADRKKISLLHIKLLLIINFVKGMGRRGSDFQYIKSNFPKVSEAKIKEGISLRVLKFDN